MHEEEDCDMDEVGDLPSASGKVNFAPGKRRWSMVKEVKSASSRVSLKTEALREGPRQSVAARAFQFQERQSNSAMSFHRDSQASTGSRARASMARGSMFQKRSTMRQTLASRRQTNLLAAGLRGKHKPSTMQNLGQIRECVSSIMSESMRVAQCRLSAVFAQVPSSKPKKEVQLLSRQHYAWPFASVGALSWLPWCLVPAGPAILLQTGRQVARHKIRGVDLSKPCKPLVPITVSTSDDYLHGLCDHPADATDIDDESEDSESPLESQRLRWKIFKIAVSEARLAQAQAVAAWRDVQTLQAALNRVNRSGQAKGSEAEKHEHEALQRHYEELRGKERALRATLQDVERQNRRLLLEVERRKEREQTPKETEPEVKRTGLPCINPLAMTPRGVRLPTSARGLRGLSPRLQSHQSPGPHHASPTFLPSV